ncbi:MAG TPA: hypothetical protein VFE46_12700 [Pirellulales bacterium]|jgi:hypothetical protein|nr:hypothetical protein [Pirellulales bacterium]
MTTGSKTPDEFDAVRIVFDALKAFKKEDQQRLIRWVQEKLGLETTGIPQHDSFRGTPPATLAHPATQHHDHHQVDIRSFIAAKIPKSDNQFAAAIAYYYKFEAPVDQRKEAITAEDLLTACRLVARKRPSRPLQVLINAHHQGILDKGERGQYRLNSVGENLVAMVLPSKESNGTERTRRPAKKKKAAKKAKRSGK